MSAITGINPTFFLKKIKYDDIVAKYEAGKYSLIPTLETNTKKYFGTLLYENSKIIGWKTIVDSITLKILYAHNLRGICAHCEFETTSENLCSFGIPEKIERKDNIITITVNTETCSLECGAICIKKFGKLGLSLDPKYMDSNSMIRGLFPLYFPDILQFKEAPSLTDLVKYGGEKTPASFKAELHHYYYKEVDLFVGSPKLKLKE